MIDRPKCDPVLLGVIAIAVAVSLNGVTVRILHPDAMAFLPLTAPGNWPFDPGWFEKPPFYTYCNYVLDVLPLSLAAKVLPLPPWAQVAWARVLLAAALAGSAMLAYATVRDAYGRVAARVVAAVLVTSAGMIAFVHQLTADVPVTFWMVAAFYFAAAILREPTRRNYVLAGLLTGVATATKYNGVAVGIAIPVAHVLRFAMEAQRDEPTSARSAPDARPRQLTDTLRRLVVDRRLITGLAAVPLGFVAGNPYAVLDHRQFRADFVYNYMVAPVYEGQTGHSWGAFFLRLADIVGVPACVAFTAAAVVSVVLVVRSGRLRLAGATFWTTAAVCALYYAKFAPFPRLEGRFVLPIVPFWLMLAAPCWARLARRGRAVATLAVALVAYNVVCGALVGSRFRADPRVRAEAWVLEHVPAGSLVESDIYSPKLEELKTEMRATVVPFVTGRERLFQQVFPGNRFINGSEATQRAAEDRVRWFSVAELMRRDPDYVVIDSLYYDRFVEPGTRRDLYPEMRAYFEDLLAERTPYRIVFDAGTASTPAPIYPRDIDFLVNRATVLARKAPQKPTA